MKVFLGGTCNSDWRKEFIDFLEYEKIDYFNPVVEDWSADCEANEEEGRICSMPLLYTIMFDVSRYFNLMLTP